MDIKIVEEKISKITKILLEAQGACVNLSLDQSFKSEDIRISSIARSALKIYNLSTNSEYEEEEFEKITPTKPLTKQYRIGNGYVNGEIISDLLNLCNNQFSDPYPGGSPDLCYYCDTSKNKDHAEGCPYTEYLHIAEKHQFIVEK